MNNAVESRGGSNDVSTSSASLPPPSADAQRTHVERTDSTGFSQADRDCITFDSSLNTYVYNRPADPLLRTDVTSRDQLWHHPDDEKAERVQQQQLHWRRASDIISDEESDHSYSSQDTAILLVEPSLLGNSRTSHQDDAPTVASRQPTYTPTYGLNTAFEYDTKTLPRKKHSTAVANANKDDTNDVDTLTDNVEELALKESERVKPLVVVIPDNATKGTKVLNKQVTTLPSKVSPTSIVKKKRSGAPPGVKRVRFADEDDDGYESNDTMNGSDNSSNSQPSPNVAAGTALPSNMHPKGYVPGVRIPSFRKMHWAPTQAGLQKDKESHVQKQLKALVIMDKNETAKPPEEDHNDVPNNSSVNLARSPVRRRNNSFELALEEKPTIQGCADIVEEDEDEDPVPVMPFQNYTHDSNLQSVTPPNSDVIDSKPAAATDNTGSAPARTKDVIDGSTTRKFHSLQNNQSVSAVRAELRHGNGSYYDLVKHKPQATNPNARDQQQHVQENSSTSTGPVDGSSWQHRAQQQQQYAMEWSIPSSGTEPHHYTAATQQQEQRRRISPPPVLQQQQAVVSHQLQQHKHHPLRRSASSATDLARAVDHVVLRDTYVRSQFRPRSDVIDYKPVTSKPKYVRSEEIYRYLDNQRRPQTSSIASRLKTSTSTQEISKLQFNSGLEHVPRQLGKRLDCHSNQQTNNADEMRYGSIGHLSSYMEPSVSHGSLERRQQLQQNTRIVGLIDSDSSRTTVNSRHLSDNPSEYHRNDSKIIARTYQPHQPPFDRVVTSSPEKNQMQNGERLPVDMNYPAYSVHQSRTDPHQREQQMREQLVYDSDRDIFVVRTDKNNYSANWETAYSDQQQSYSTYSSIRNPTVNPAIHQSAAIVRPRDYHMKQPPKLQREMKHSFNVNKTELVKYDDGINPSQDYFSTVL